ncbi:MAG TPA: glycosyltransferase family 4 protein [Chitinophagaceae bacterium]|nr:glycosyltransferase family 4 protein [Chitinophagaceae bacterium]
MNGPIGIVVFDITLSAGTERATVNLANTLAKKGHEVTIISIGTKEGVPFYTPDEKVSIIHLGLVPSARLWKRFLFNYFFVGRKLLALTQNRRWTLLGTSHAINFILATVKMMRPSNYCIGCEHISYASIPGYSRKVRSRLYRKLDAVVVLTESDRQKYSAEDKLENCVVIPNQIPFYPDKAADYSSRNLLAIGRFTYQKGFDLMLPLVQGPLQLHKDWSLTIIGEGEMKDQLQVTIAELGLKSQVRLMPPTRDILNEYQKSSVYLMSSRFEGLPMVLLEAKACGLPIIAYDCPTGPREVIMPDDGILVEMNDHKHFMEAILELMENEDQRTKLGSQGRINVLKFGPENIYQKWSNLLNRLYAGNN